MTPPVANATLVPPSCDFGSTIVRGFSFKQTIRQPGKLVELS